MKLSYKKYFLTIVICIFSIVIKSYNVCASNIIKVNSQLNDKYKIGHTIPVEVLVQADESDLSGELKMCVLEDTYTHKVNIVNRNSKKYTFNIPVKQLTKEINVTLESNKKIVDEKKLNINTLNNDVCCIGVLSDSYKDFNFLSDLKVSPLCINKAECINLNDKELNLELLNCLDLIILDNFNPNKLSDISSDSLDKWIRNGGIIFLGSGKYANKNLKGVFENINNTTHVGNGSIVPVKFDINMNNTHKLQKCILNNLNNKILSNLSSNVNLKNNLNNIKQLNGTANSMLKLNNNIMYFLICVLVIYIASGIFIIVLKKNNIYCWLGLIVITSLVTFSVYEIEGIGKEKITMACLNKYYEGGRNSERLMNMYPCNKKIKLSLDNAIDICNIDSNNFSIDNIDKIIDYDHIKETKYLYSSFVDNVDFEEVNNINIENNHVDGEIKNNLPYDLKDCLLIVGNSCIKIGSLKQGESIKLNYELDNNLNCVGDYEYVNLMEQELENKYEKQLLRAYLNSNKYEKFNCNLIGFSKRKISHKINNKNKKLNSINIDVCPIKINFISKQIKYPFGLIKPIVSKQLNNDNVSFKEYTFKKDESIYIYYVLPKDMNIKEIELTDSFKDGQFIVERFDYGSSSWKKIDSLVMRNIDDLNTNKLLALRLKGKGRVLIPDISLKGIMN